MAGLGMLNIAMDARDLVVNSTDRAYLAIFKIPRNTL